MLDNFPSQTIKINTNSCGSLFLTIGYNDNKIIHVQIHMGKSGTCVHTAHILVENLINHAIKKNTTVEEFEDLAKIPTCLADANHSCYTQVLLVLTETMRMRKNEDDITQALSKALYEIRDAI